MNTPQTSLVDIALSSPAASRVLQRHRLDYCCRGKRTLADACAARGLDPGALLSEIGEPGEAQGQAPGAWAGRPISELVDHIVSRYHEPLRTELPALVAMARKVERVHGDKPSCPHGLAALLEGITEGVFAHLDKEEQILFPLIASGRGTAAHGPVTMMTREHEDHGENLERIRGLTCDLVPPEDACTTWRTLYLRLEELERELMDHIALEEGVLFPRALRG